MGKKRRLLHWPVQTPQAPPSRRLPWATLQCNTWERGQASAAVWSVCLAQQTAKESQTQKRSWTLFCDCSPTGFPCPRQARFPRRLRTQDRSPTEQRMSNEMRRERMENDNLLRYLVVVHHKFIVAHGRMLTRAPRGCNEKKIKRRKIFDIIYYY